MKSYQILRILYFLAFLAVMLSWYVLVSGMGKWHNNRHSSPSNADSLLLQGHRLELRMEDLRKSTDSLLFLHLIQLDYTSYLEYKIDSLVKELNK